MDVDGIYFDASAARLHLGFASCLTLTECTKSGQPEPLVLLPPHKKLVVNVLCWKRADGRRLYRRVYFSVARKNAKTQGAAVVGIDLLVLDPEPRQQIYIAAGDTEQASNCYRAAKAMVEADEELSDLLVVKDYRREIINPATGSVLRAISAVGKNKHGFNPSTVILDELHVWGADKQELYDALTSGSGARRQPLFIILTTAGVDEYSICGREYDRACKVRDGIIQDPTYLPMIYEIPKDADWTDERNWLLSNPCLGETVQIDFLREEKQKALEDPSEQSKFRRLYGNQWVNSASTWIPRISWDACCLTDSDPILATAGLTSQPSTI